MAMTNQEANWVGRQLEYARRILDIMADYAEDKQLFVGEDFGSTIVDADFTSYTNDAGDTPYAHMTQGKMYSMVNSLDALQATLDDESGAPGSDTYRLSLIKTKG